MKFEKFSVNFFVLFALLLQSCAPALSHKIPESKEDYNYYGSENKATVDAIKYCHANEEEFEKSETDFKQKIKLSLGYKKLRELAKTTDSKKEYPIPEQDSLGNRTFHYAVVVPLVVITSPLWIWFYLDSNNQKKLKTVAEHVKYCDGKYLGILSNEEIVAKMRDSTSWIYNRCDRDVKLNREYDSNMPVLPELKKLHKIYTENAEQLSSTPLAETDVFDPVKTKTCIGFYKKMEIERKEGPIREKKNNKALANKYGYEDLFPNGLWAMVSGVTAGQISLAKAKSLLVKTSDFDSVLRISEIAYGYAIYRSPDGSVVLAIKKENNQFYGTGSAISGELFAIANVENLGGLDMLVFKKVK